ncbi:myosin-3-like [Montipora foliosa]|uniref:myosin-3-like n=1 Tax=Montipora foliosa TaxID=591990 RepID=UPI0035F1347C
MVVTVNWNGEKVDAEILALDDDVKVLSAKDLDWSKKNLPAVAEQKEATKLIETPKKKVARSKKPIEVNSTNPYEDFLTEQKKRELEWKLNREAKRTKVLDLESLSPNGKSDKATRKENIALPIDPPISEVAPAKTSVEVSGDCTRHQEDLVNLLHQELAAKSEECHELRSRLERIEALNVQILDKQVEMQEKFDKLLEKLQTSVSRIEEGIARNSSASDLERRLNVLEGQIVFNQCNPLESTVIREWDDEIADTTDPPAAEIANTTDPPAAESAELTTIDHLTLNELREEYQPTTDKDNSGAKQGSLPQEVGEEIISTCVTPTRVKTIRQALLKSETERHLCALKLLPHFFTKEELAESNTDGSYDKKRLDSAKLNSLKVLVFSKFPVSTNKEKEKAWRFVKGKINSKCRTARKTLLAASPSARTL